MKVIIESKKTKSYKKNMSKKYTQFHNTTNII